VDVPRIARLSQIFEARVPGCSPLFASTTVR
jgi:hypothetical protein